MKMITMDIPDAADAKAAIEQGDYQAAQRQAQTISVKINDAIKLGLRAISVDKLEEPVKAALTAKGYKVKYDSGGDMRDPYPSSYNISWI